MIDLTEFCEPKGRTIMQHPWRLMVEGCWWTAGTDGRIAVLVKDQMNDKARDAPAELATDRVAASLNGILNVERLPIGATTAEAVYAWAGIHEQATEGPCGNCGGDGECNRCECEQQHECGACKGTGKEWEPPEQREGVVGDRVMDRNLLAKAFQHLTGPCEVLVGVKSQIVEFRAAGWRVLQMPLERKKIEPEWPVLSLTAEAVAS